MDYMKKSVLIIALKGKIKGLEAISRELRKQANATKGDDKDSLLRKKGSLGDHTRYHLIAYALIRGVPFYVVENTNGKDYKHPDPQRVLTIIEQHDTFRRNGKHRYTRWTLDDVKELLTVQPPAQAAEAAE